jgi:hypothetical protein
LYQSAGCFPVWRSPIITHVDRPIGIIASIASKPVCKVHEQNDEIIPGAIDSIKRVSDGISPFPSIGRANGLTTEAAL